MNRVSEELDSAIRERLEYMTEGLEDGVILSSDVKWSVEVIKDLLLDVYLLQDELRVLKRITKP